MAAQVLVVLSGDLIFGRELTLLIGTCSFAAPVNPYPNVGVLVLSLQRLSRFPQIWSVLSSSSHKSLLGLNRAFSSVVWHGSLLHPYHWTLKLRGPLLPPRAAEEMGVRKIWRKCRGTCVRPRWVREGLGEPGGGKGEHGRRQSQSRAALANTQRRGGSLWWGFLNFRSLPFDFCHCLKEDFWNKSNASDSLKWCTRVRRGLALPACPQPQQGMRRCPPGGCLSSGGRPQRASLPASRKTQAE